jgi:cytochrome c biogenesis protein CcmG, thiol:disulfide interchange protein DsbE
VKRRSAWGLAVLLILGGLGGWYFTKPRPAEKRLVAPEFTLPDPDGKQIKLAGLLGKPLVVHFWASWCPPCTDELPELMATAAKVSALGIQFVLVSNDSDWSKAMKTISKGKRSDSVTLLLDTDGKVAERFGTFQLPETYLLGKDGRILMKWVGPQPWTSEEMAKGLAEITQAEPKS